MFPIPHWVPGNAAGPSSILHHLHAPLRAQDATLCSHAMPHSMEPLQAPSVLCTWVLCAPMSTLGSSHLAELYPGKETWVPSGLRFCTSLGDFCHAPYSCAELRERTKRTRQRALLLCQRPTVSINPLLPPVQRAFSLLLEHGSFTCSACLLLVIGLSMYMYLLTP